MGIRMNFLYEEPNMLKPPRVSVVMPVYNVETYVAEAIQSVLNQTFEDFELLIVDDGGSDRSFAICEAFSDPRISIIQQRNRGLAGARNTGIGYARGDYVALLDSDDRWDPTKLALHLIHLDANPDVGVSYCGSRFIDQRGNPLRQRQSPKLSGITVEDILCRNPVGNGSAAVIRKSVLDAVAFPHPEDFLRLCYFDEAFRQSEDIELWVRLALTLDCKFEGISPPLTEYRIVAAGLSANIVRQFESWQTMMDKTEQYASGFIDRHGTNARAFQLRYLARRAVQMGDGSFALSLLRQSIAASHVVLWREPKKTLTTFLAAWAIRFLSPATVTRLAQKWTNAEVMA
jgi:glycosyltransferase involved in cell wall biosynthesis